MAARSKSPASPSTAPRETSAEPPPSTEPSAASPKVSLQFGPTPSLPGSRLKGRGH